MLVTQALRPSLRTGDGGVEHAPRRAGELCLCCGLETQAPRAPLALTQVYTANWVDAEPPFCRHAAVCLETQHLPDAINQPTFPSPVATPEAPFAHATRHRFSVA